MPFRLSRRGFLAGTAALAARPAFATETPEVLRAAVGDQQILPEGYGTTTLWTFGATPGPQIRLRQGERLMRRVENALAQPTSVHWHGIRIANEMDGVPGLTQAAILPGESFDYDFIVPDAGTYWYHSHNRSFEQVSRGLYGALIVEEAEAPEIDREEVLILDDWLVDPETSQLYDSFGSMHDMSHAGRIGNYITTNAAYNLALPARRNERMRLRLINAATARVFPLRLDGLAGWIVALDGMPLAAPRKVEGPFLLAPAQRIDVIVDVTAEAGGTAHLSHVERGEVFSQVAFEVAGEASSAPRDAPAELPPNRVVLPDLANARVLPMKMEGGAMGGMQSGMMGGRMRSMREMAEAGAFWALNGTVGAMDGPAFAVLALGETVRLVFENATAFPHAMHLHGMHFHEIGRDGALGDMRDTTLVQPDETREVAFVAENPGEWLLHCHMLSHAASGMTTRISVG
jgi:FtsP/CotA-like multicopper oxidase with cupredoxin domain